MLTQFFFLAAGDSYCRAAALHIKLDSRHEAASDYVEAGNCYRKVNPAGKGYV